jgi:cytochrome c
MTRFMIAGAVIALTSMPALAEGDPEAGREAFSQCQTCHVVENEDGEILAGRNAKQGPNLYNVVGRQAGSVDGFRYRPSIMEAGEAGLVWSEADLVPYLQDPNTFLRETLDDRRARSGMAYRVRTEEEAMNLAAFLASVSPDAATEEEGEAEGS